MIGGAITDAAVKKSYDVTVLSRRAPFGKWKDLSASFIQGDWRDDAFAKELVKNGFDVVVDTQIFDEIHMERTTRIVNNFCKQLIYISTDSVYAHPNERLSENADIIFEDIKWDYGIDKRKAELFLQSHSGEYSFNWTVIRPTITFGETRIPVGFSCKRGTYTLIERIEKQKPIVRFDNPETRHSLCHVSIFGDAAVGLFLNENAYGGFYHISDDCSYTYDELFHAIESVVGKKGIYFFADVDLLKKYNTSIYDEMIYDKNPEFTLDNTNIKRICPNVNYHVDFQGVITDTIQALHKHREEVGEDKDYDLLSDLIILKSKRRFNTDNNELVSEYLKKMPDEYVKRIKRYGADAHKHIVVRRIKNILRPIKKIILCK